MKRLLLFVQQHLSATRSESLAVICVVTIMVVGTLSSRLFPRSYLHEHISAEQLGKILDSLDIQESRQNASLVAAEPDIETAPHRNKARQGPIGKVNINTANAAALERIPGIGPAMAQRIIEHRQRSKFHTPEDLIDVKGIGEKKLDKMRPYVIAP